MSQLIMGNYMIMNVNGSINLITRLSNIMFSKQFEWKIIRHLCNNVLVPCAQITNNVN